METVPVEIFHKIVKHFNVREVRALALLSKKMHVKYTAFLKIVVRAGNSYLYTRQVKSLDYIKTNLRNHPCNRIILNAYMSFGKTLVGFETARHMLKMYPEKCVLIIIPNTVLAVWTSESIKHYSEYTMYGPVKNRKIFYICPQLTSHATYVRSIIRHQRFAELSGKIIICASTCNLGAIGIPYSMVSIIIVDEYHRNAASIEKQLNRNEILGKIPILMMGASIIDKPDGTENISMQKLSTRDAILPCAHLNIELNCKLDAIRDKIIMSQDKHICVALRAQYEVDHLEQSLRPCNKPIYNYKTRSIKKYDVFARTGGVLLTTINCITEGNNINHCKLFIIQCSDENFLSLKRTQQLVGRVIRQSAHYNDINILFYISTHVMQARAIASIIPCSGYEIRNASLPHRMQRIADKWRTMTHGELLLVLCENIVDNPHFEGDICARSMTEAELHKLILF